MAWGMLGHRIVGEIASTYLTPKARKEIQQILGTESIAMASNWADFIKSDTTYKYLNSWHYIDFDSAINYTRMQSYLKSDTATDAYTKLNFLIRKLKNKKLSQNEKLMYLRLLIHIAGDVHQPLHSARTGDAGGNEIKVSWFGQPSNLHRVWDEQLIEFQRLSYTEYAAAINHASVKQRLTWQKQSISNWLFDSYRISEQLRKELQQPEQKLSFQYNFRHIETLNEQLLKGGVHLAGLLNQIFG
ncbi:S1/P1 nuclease [Segetibacter koreensis]|uniref:S1/P1 nuclease n=1 Tax=Segetibacter koreensis TaxID=398037 RepID=UPI001B7FE616|nr:S1/P1 nuclease [Segetibacter koreensis]